MKPLTAIAISGGIDSLTAAFLLKQKGQQVLGIHFLTGYEVSSRAVTTMVRQIHGMADQLAIPIEIVDCTADFKTNVVDYFVRSYRTGLTPNPCLVCNPTIKFGAVFAFARQLGATRLATGHYARIRQDDNNEFHLHRGVDLEKDQSYFLARLTSEQLAHAVFPLGQMTKVETKNLARANGLKPISHKESQDVCFIHGPTYGEFLEQHGTPSRPGPIVNLQGQVLGQHKGLHHYTIGQRRGINCPASHPYYVLKIDPKQNRLTVGTSKDLSTDRCSVEGINWIQSPPTESLHIRTRVRYRHTAASSMLVPNGPQAADVFFDVPQKALTPGQGAVFYDGDEVLGGGWIVR